MATPFRLKRSAVTGKRPGLTDLEKGELALNFYDGNLFAERDTGGAGIGTTVTNLTPWKEQFSRDEIHYTGVVSATTYHGDQIIGTPTAGSFRTGAYSAAVDDKTKDSIEVLNYILGKLVPKAPDDIDGVALDLTNDTEKRLCAGFTPTNNTGGSAPSAGSLYVRNTTSQITTDSLTQFGPGGSGTVTGFVNAVGVGTTTLNVSFGDAAVKSDNGTYGALQILNEKDAAESTRNTGITSLFYEVVDMRLVNAASPDGYNKAHITHGAATSGSTFWYEDPSTVGAPSLTVSTAPVTPSSSSHVVAYSSGIPHYTQSSNNAFNYVITCTNATGDMYNSNTFVTTGGQTSGFASPGNKNYTNFAGGANPPVRNYGVGSGVTCAVSQVPRNVHYIAQTTNTKFSNMTASTPYGSNSARATISEKVLIMGTSATTSKIDEDNILISSLGTGSGNAVRVKAGATGDNPSPVTTSWTGNSAGTIDTYEAAVVGGILKHDVTNYSSGYLPAGGPDFSSGRSGDQYFQILLTRTNVSTFNISYTGSCAGCWVCLPDNSTWTTGLNNTNGWADMFNEYIGSGVPRNIDPGCAYGGVMDNNGGTFTCTFGTESSSNGAGKILIRWKLTSGQSITAMSFTST